MRKRFVVAGLVLLAVLILINIPLFDKFTISDGKSGKVVYVDDVSNVREFYVSFRHSVNKTPVNEFYKIENNRFVVYKTTFYSYGAGMPEYDAKGKEKVTITNGLVQIENMDIVFNSFTYRVGTYADHSFNWEGGSFKLSRYVKPQSPARFEIKKLSVMDLVFFRIKGKITNLGVV